MTIIPAIPPSGTGHRTRLIVFSFLSSPFFFVSCGMLKRMGMRSFVELGVHHTNIALLGRTRDATQSVVIKHGSMFGYTTRMKKELTADQRRRRNEFLIIGILCL